MLADSGLLDLLPRHAVFPFGQPMCVYYPLRLNLQTSCRNAFLTPDMQAFNASMSAVRVSVEWLFGDIVNYFKFVDFSNVGKIYIVCAIALLKNALTCLYGNVTSEYFDCHPP